MLKDDLNDLVKNMQRQTQQGQPGQPPQPGQPMNVHQVASGIKKWIFLSIVMVIVLTLLPGVIIIWSLFGSKDAPFQEIFKNGFSMKGFDAMLVDGNADVPGDPANFDPIKNYEAVRSFAGEGAQLLSMDANLVRSDGTLELTASYKPSPTVNYEFVRELQEPPEDAAPLGVAGSSPDGKWYEPVNVTIEQPGQSRHVTKIGGGSNVEGSYSTKGMLKDIGTATGKPGTIVPAPTCSLADLWQIAIEQGAPKEAVANIDYDGNGYEFDITGTGISLEFGSDCKLKA